MKGLIAACAVVAAVALAVCAVLFLRVRKVEANLGNVARGHLRESDVREIVASATKATASHGGVSREEFASTQRSIVQIESNIRQLTEAYNGHIAHHNSAATTTTTTHYHDEQEDEQEEDEQEEDTKQSDAEFESDDIVAPLPASVTMGAPVVSPPSVTVTEFASPIRKRRSGRVAVVSSGASS